MPLAAESRYGDQVEVEIGHATRPSLRAGPGDNVLAPRHDLTLIYRDARVTHAPRYSCIGPSLMFAIIAATNRSTKNASTARSSQLLRMRLSLFSAYNPS